jgi:hypothetical protein
MTALTRINSNCNMRTITVSVQLENKITNRDAQGACRQDELIGGKPAVVKNSESATRQSQQKGEPRTKSFVRRK